MMWGLCFNIIVVTMSAVRTLYTLHHVAVAQLSLPGTLQGVCVVDVQHPVALAMPLVDAEGPPAVLEEHSGDVLQGDFAVDQLLDEHPLCGEGEALVQTHGPALRQHEDLAIVLHHVRVGQVVGCREDNLEVGPGQALWMHAHIHAHTRAHIRYVQEFVTHTHTHIYI